MKKEEEVVEDIKDPNEIKELTDLPGVGPSTAVKLEQAGFRDFMAIATASNGALAEATGMGVAPVKKIIAAARAALKMDYASALEVEAKRKNATRIPTGSPEFNRLLGGGIEAGSVTECYGEGGSGKTQLAHSLPVWLHSLDPEAYTVVCDTEHTYTPGRVRDIATANGIDGEKVLEHIKIAQAFSTDHQMLLCEKVDELIKNGLKVKLLIVDSISSLFRSEFFGRGMLADRQQKLNRHLHQLAKLADAHSIAVYITNQVMSDPSAMFMDPTKSVGGHVISHAANARIYLRKGKKGSRVAKLVDSSNLAEGEAIFVISDKGIVDVKE